MADGAWGLQAHTMHSEMSGLHKRPRPDYDLPSSGMAAGVDMHNYVVREDGQGGLEAAKDNQTLVSAYDHYLQSTQMPSYNVGEASNLCGALLVSNLAVDTMSRPVRDAMPLPQDASNTLYVESLPPNCTKREVAHIFRPFVGYKEVRLVTKESKHRLASHVKSRVLNFFGFMYYSILNLRGGYPLILCFVDFVDAPCAATAMSALQGYRMDEDNPDSAYLRIQFSRHPGARAGGGPRGRR